MGSIMESSPGCLGILCKDILYNCFKNFLIFVAKLNIKVLKINVNIAL